jgi:hypothetical protein
MAKAKKAKPKAARAKRVRRIKMPIASVVEIKIPKHSAPLIVHKAPDTIHVVTAPRDVATKQGWWDYLFGDR